MIHERDAEGSNVRPTNESDPDLWIYLNGLTDLVLGRARVASDDRGHAVKQRAYAAFGAGVLVQKEIEPTEPERGRRTVVQARYIRGVVSLEQYEFYENEDFLALIKGKAATESIVVGRATPEERIEAYLNAGQDRLQ